MADKQGLYVGSHISQVQFFCLGLLGLMDRIQKLREDERTFKLALLATGRYEDSLLFPEHFTAEVRDEIPESTDQEGNPVSTTYDLSSATYDPAKVEAEIAAMMAAAQMMENTFEIDDEWK